MSQALLALLTFLFTIFFPFFCVSNDASLYALDLNSKAIQVDLSVLEKGHVTTTTRPKFSLQQLYLSVGVPFQKDLSSSLIFGLDHSRTQLGIQEVSIQVSAPLLFGRYWDDLGLKRTLFHFGQMRIPFGLLNTQFIPYRPFIDTPLVFKTLFQSHDLGFMGSGGTMQTTLPFSLPLDLSLGLWQQLPSATHAVIDYRSALTAYRLSTQVPLDPVNPLQIGVSHLASLSSRNGDPIQTLGLDFSYQKPLSNTHSILMRHEWLQTRWQQRLYSGFYHYIATHFEPGYDLGVRYDYLSLPDTTTPETAFVFILTRHVNDYAKARIQYTLDLDQADTLSFQFILGAGTDFSSSF